MIHKTADPDETTLMNVTVSAQLMDIERNRFSTFWSRPMNATRFSSINIRISPTSTSHFAFCSKMLGQKVPGIRLPENELIFNVRFAL